MSNIFVPPELKDHIIKKIIEVCERGLITLGSPAIPDTTIQAYNRVLNDCGGLLGWLDFSRHKINPEKVINEVNVAIDIYNKACEGLIKNGVIPEVVERFSPVLILESLMKQEEKDLVLSLAQCHIYSIIALLEAALFFDQCEPFFRNSEFQETHENLINIIEAQSNLLIAQEAANKAYELLYKAKDVVREKISNTDEEMLQLEIERLQSLPRHAARIKNKKPDRLYEALQDGVSKIVESDTQNHLYAADIVELTREYVIDRNEYYDLGWDEPDKALKMSWFEKALKDNDLIPARYRAVDSSKGKNAKLREETKRQAREHLGL